jgi:hypothetical protein
MRGSLLGMAGSAGAGLMSDMGQSAIEDTDRFSLWNDQTMPDRPISPEDDFSSRYTEGPAVGEEADGFAAWYKQKYPEAANDWATQAGLIKSKSPHGAAQAHQLGLSQSQAPNMMSNMSGLMGMALAGDPMKYRRPQQFTMNPLWS